jgi:hypothetical protein
MKPLLWVHHKKLWLLRWLINKLTKPDELLKQIMKVVCFFI